MMTVLHTLHGEVSDVHMPITLTCTDIIRVLEIRLCFKRRWQV